MKRFWREWKFYTIIYGSLMVMFIGSLNFHFLFKSYDSFLPLFFGILFFIVSIISPVLVSVFLVRECFYASSLRQSLLKIFLSYIGVILWFSVLYFLCSVFADYSDAHFRSI